METKREKGPWGWEIVPLGRHSAVLAEQKGRSGRGLQKPA